MTHQSVRPYSVTCVSANPSFRSANCPYLSVHPVRFGVAVDPPIGSIYQPLPVHPVSPNELHACMRACILIQSIRQSNSLVLASLLSYSLFLPPPLLSHSLLSIYLSSYPFAVVRLLPFRAPTWILHAASIYRTTYRAPVQLVLHSRESRESPGDSPRRDSLAWTSRGRAGNGIRKEVRARSRPTTRRR